MQIALAIMLILPYDRSIKRRRSDLSPKKESPAYSPMSMHCVDFEPYADVTPFPGYHGLHCHDFFEIYIYFSGASYHSLGDQISPLVPCTLVIIPPFHMHGLVGTKADIPYERAWLYITPSIVQKVGMDTLDLNHYFKKCVQSGKAYFPISHQTADTLRSIIQELRQHMDDKTDAGRWQNTLRVAQFLSHVYSLTQTVDAFLTPVVLNESIQDILSYINDHYREPISIPELSRRFGISTSHMTREFTAYTGRSVYDYVLYRRIQSAKEMIYVGKPFTEIAFECGFNDYSCFLRAFQKLTGQSPSAYRKYIHSIEKMP